MLVYAQQIDWYKYYIDHGTCVRIHARERASKSVVHSVKKSKFHSISAGSMPVPLPFMCILCDIHKDT